YTTRFRSREQLAVDRAHRRLASRVAAREDADGAVEERRLTRERIGVEEVRVLAIRDACRETGLARRQVREPALQVELRDRLLHLGRALQVRDDRVDTVLRRREALDDREPRFAAQRAARDARGAERVALEERPATVVRKVDQV